MPDATQDASTRNKEFIQTCKRIARPGRAELQSCFIVLLAVTVPMCRCARLLQFVEFEMQAGPMSESLRPCLGRLDKIQ